MFGNPEMGAIPASEMNKDQIKAAFEQALENMRATSYTVEDAELKRSKLVDVNGRVE